MWRLAPFYVAVAAAPILFGGIKLESQAILGFLLGLGLIFSGLQKENVKPFWLGWLKILCLVILLAPLVPLPLGAIKLLSPERARLALEFPAADWVTLSVSPARTAERLWQILLAVAAFTLARQSAMRSGGSRRLALTLGIALALLAASDVWSRAHGRESVLGIWPVTWGKGAGTFANRNHFANWIYMAALFCGGWVLRELLRRERKARIFEIVFVIVAVIVGLGFAILGASRAGAAAFLIGALAAGFLQRKRIRTESYGLAASIAIIGIVAVTFLSGERLIGRLRQEQTGRSLTYKKEIWRETLGMIQRFPLTGAGAGTFVRVFDHYKTNYADLTVLHAENDYVELPLEYGLPGALLFLSGLFLFFRALRTEQALMAGLIGGLVMFGAHAAVEFVSFVPSNLMLAGVLAGFAAGRSHERTALRRDWLQMAAGAAMILIAAWQWIAWPFAMNREIALARSEAQKAETRAQAEARLAKAISVDPLNWELRLERAWLDLAYSTNRARAISNAWLTVRLNPLQGQIPLRFARHFGRNNPDAALAFLKAVNPVVRANHQAALELAWEISSEPAWIWEVTPNTVPALENVIYFAIKMRLPAVLAEAARLLEGRAPPETLARRFLEADRPAEALRLVANAESFDGLRLRALALARLGRLNDAMVVAQKVFAANQVSQSGFQPNASHTQLLEQFRANPNPAAALILAEKTAAMAPLDLRLLSELAGKFPTELRINYLLFRSQLAMGQTNAAANTAVELLPRLAP